MRFVAALILSAGLAVAQNATVGQVAFQNSGAPAAQRPFLDGLAQLHNFEYASAAELFRRAQQADPAFAMAYWGEAMSYNHAVWMEQDLGGARRTLARLGPSRDARIAKGATPRERAYLRAAETLYGDGDKHARDLAYADAMADLHAAYPDDPDAAAFYALALLGTAHAGRDFSIYMRAAAVVEPVFHDYPNHPGAAHYLIHSYDDPIHAPLGLRAARAYSKIAPSAGHAQHMTAHIFLALGLWDEEVEANEAAVRVVDAGRAGRGLTSSVCGHYNFWLEYGYLQQRRFTAAKQLLANCYAAARVAPAPAAGTQLLDPDNTPANSFAGMRLRYLLDTEDWSSDVVGWTADTRSDHRAQIAFEFGTGYAAARSGRLAEAATALERLGRERRALEAALPATALGRTEQGARDWGRILEIQLSAIVDTAAGRRVEALGKLREAAAAEDAMPMEFGPPAVDKPSSELLGELLLSLDRAAEARVAFDASLARAPGRTLSLSGVWQAALKSGDAPKAAATRARLRAIWHRADTMPSDVPARN